MELLSHISQCLESCKLCGHAYLFYCYRNSIACASLNKSTELNYEPFSASKCARKDIGKLVLHPGSQPPCCWRVISEGL